MFKCEMSSEVVGHMVGVSAGQRRTYGADLGGEGGQWTCESGQIVLNRAVFLGGGGQERTTSVEVSVWSAATCSCRDISV